MQTDFATRIVDDYQQGRISRRRLVAQLMALGAVAAAGGRALAQLGGAAEAVTVAQVDRLLNVSTGRAMVELLDQRLPNAASYEKLAIAERLVSHVAGSYKRVSEPVVIDGESLVTSEDRAAWALARLFRLPKGTLTDLAPDARPASAAMLVEAYRAGVADASTEARRAVDRQRLRNEFRGRITEGRVRISTLHALRELFAKWPPIGADVAEFAEITGLDLAPGGPGDREMIFHYDYMGLAGTRYTIVIRAGRIVSVVADLLD